MSEFLTVRISKQKDKALSWLVWSTGQNEIIASGELAHHDQIEELTAYANKRTTILLLDSSDVILSEVDIPAGASRQLDNMLPFIMEDDIAQDVEELHFTVLKKSAALANVAVVDSRYLNYLLTTFSDVGIEVKKVLPDVLAMPDQRDVISALQLGQQWLFRKAAFSGLVIDNDWLPFFIESEWRVSAEGEIPVVSYTSAPEDIHDIDWRTEEPELVMELLAKGAIASPVNLLSGVFKPQSSILKHLKLWRGAAIAACLLFVIVMVKSYMTVTQAENQAASYRAESERIFRTVFPDKKRIPTVSYLKRQMNDEVRRLTGGDSGNSVLSWLVMLPEALNKKDAVKFTSLRYDSNRGEVRIDAQMKDFQTFEVVRKKLEENFEVTQGPLDKEGEAVTGNFVLRRKQ